MRSAKARAMFWLVVHDVCPCALAQRLRLPRSLARRASSLCDRMDRWLYA